jgi:hypothetical protein
MSLLNTRRTMFVLAWLLVAIAPTAGAQPRRPAPTPVPAAPAPTPTPALTEDDLFNEAAMQEIALTINTRDWNDLREKYTENTYYLADLRWRGLTVRNIGIRSRGNTSRDPNKPGLRLDFDRYASAQEFLGFKSLVLDNMVQDPAMLRERVAMKFFREMDLPAPRVVHARLIVNNQFLGLYTIVEPIDKKFLKRSLGENDGYLYEFQGTGSHYDFGYRGEELEAYAALFEPKTRETASMFDLYRPIKEMTLAIGESPSHRFLEGAGEFLDLRKFLTYVAVEAFLAERDGILGEWGMNNFYLYRFEKGTRFQLLPWDRDTALYDLELSVYNRVERNVLMKRLLEYPEMRTVYEDALRKCAEVAMRPEADPAPEPPSTSDDDEPPPARPGWLEREVRTVYQQIRSVAQTDTRAPFSVEEFEAEIEKLLNTAKRRAEMVLQDLVRAASATDR